jgi:hypothetical protein
MSYGSSMPAIVRVFPDSIAVPSSIRSGATMKARANLGTAWKGSGLTDLPCAARKLAQVCDFTRTASATLRSGAAQCP